MVLTHDLEVAMKSFNGGRVSFTKINKIKREEIYMSIYNTVRQLYLKIWFIG